MLWTPRLHLRPALMDDALNLLELSSDPEVMRYTGDAMLNDIKEAHELISSRLLPEFQNHRMGRFIILLHDGTFLGLCGLRYSPDQNEVDLGYRILKKYWSQGYATEASQACLEYGFRNLNLNRILAKTMPQNLASIKVLHKLKMNFKGYQRDQSDPLPFIHYDMLQSEFNP